MHLSVVLGLLAGALGLAAYPPYVRGIIRGTTKPARATWLIWSILSIIALGSQLSAGAHWSLAMTVAKTLGAVTVAILALRYGGGSLERRDWIALAAAVAGLGVWLFMSQPLLALLLVISVDATGSWMTLQKTYQRPETETPVTWLLNAASSACGLLAVGSWKLTLLVYPAYLLLANGVIAAVVVAGQHSRQQAKLTAEPQPTV